MSSPDSPLETSSLVRQPQPSPVSTSLWGPNTSCSASPRNDDDRPYWGRQPRKASPPRTRSGRMVVAKPPPIRFTPSTPSRAHTSDRTLMSPARRGRHRSEMSPDAEALSTTTCTSPPLPLATLLRGSLYCRTYRMASASDQSSYPNLLGRFSEHVLLTVFLRYVNEDGMMDMRGWLRFYKESGLMLTHCPHDEEGEVLDEVGGDMEPQLLARTLLFMQGRTEEGTITLGHFWSLLCRVSRVVFPDQYRADPGDALDRMMKEVVLPLYMLEGRGRVELSERQALVDQRIFLLLISYASNLWRVFRLYAHDPLGRAPPENKVFPHDAQNSERNLAVLVSGVPQVLPGREHQRESFSASFASYNDSAIFTISQQCFIRFAEEYGLCPILLPKARLRKIFSAITVGQRGYEGELWPAYISPWTHDPTPWVKQAMLTTRTITKLQSSKGYDTSSRLLRSTLVNNQLNSPGKPSTGGKEAFPGDLATFCEFQQMLVEVALEGLGKANYRSLFPTSYAKVAALLMDFNVVNMNKLAQVRQMRSNKADPALCL